MSLRTKRAEILRFKEAYQEHQALDRIQHRSQQQKDRLQELRSEINRSVPVINSYVNEVGESTTIHYSPPPAVGGLAGQFNLLQNIFNPSLFGREQNLLDMLDRAIGRYNYLIKNEWKKWINPLHWVGEIIRLPFHLLRFSGFDASKTELSIFGKIYKFIAGLAAFIVGLIKIYQFVKPLLQSQGINIP